MPTHSFRHLATLKTTQFCNVTKWDFITKPLSFQFHHHHHHRSFKHCINQGSTKLPNIQKPPQSCKHKKSDMAQISIYRTHNSGITCEPVSQHFLLGACELLQTSVCEEKKLL